MRSSSFFVLANALVFLASAHPALAALKTCTTNHWTVQGSVKPYYQASGASVQIGTDGGWVSLPTGKAVCGSKLLRTTFKVAGGLTVPLYVSEDTDDANVERVVIGSAAKGRDGWYYFNSITNARNKAAGNLAGIDEKRIAVLVPQFMNTADKAAGSASTTDLLFKGLSWSSGENGVGAGSTISSFDVLDRLVDFVKSRYPKAKTIVFAGHSLGAQAINRYSTLRKAADGSAPTLEYFIANPGSWLYITPDVPVPSDTCSKSAHEYKYFVKRGDSQLPPYARTDVDVLDQKGVLTRYATRKVHVAVGQKDYGPGDTSCAAGTQGKNHRQRGRLYVEAVKKALGGDLPPAWTYDTIPACTHDPDCMFGSDIGIARLFTDGYPGFTGKKSKKSRRGTHKTHQALTH